MSVSGPACVNTYYQYNGDGVRTSKTQNSVETKYINDVARRLTQVIMETDNAGAMQAVYTYGNDMISMKRADVNSFYLYDGLGSTRQLTADDESVAACYTYDSFGNVIASSGSVNNAYGFTGEEQFDEADSLVFLRARYYEPKAGRFISRDPIGYEGGINLYAYVNNNPIRYRDPFGLLTCEEMCARIYRVDVAICGWKFEVDVWCKKNPIGGAIKWIICMEKARHNYTKCVNDCDKYI